jgi:hypothetical protein
MTVLTQNGMKLIFYPGQHGMTRIDPVDSVLTQNGIKLIFSSPLTWFDSY